MYKRISFFLSVTLLIVVVAAMVLPGCTTTEPTTQTPAKEEPKGPIKFALLTDLTGPSAASSKPATDGLAEYFNYINSKGGVDGCPLEFVPVDTRYDVNLAVTGFEKVAGEKVYFVYGFSSNFQTIIKPLASKYKVVYVGLPEPSALLPVTKDMYNFGASQTYSDMYRCSLTYLKDRWKKSDPPRVGIIGLDAAFSKTAIKTTKWMLQNELKWPIVAEEYMAMAATDASSQVTNLKNAKCDYIIMASTGVPQIIFCKAAKAMGLMDQSLLIDTFLVGVTAFRNAAPDAMDGIISHATFGGPDTDPGHPLLKEFETLLKANRPDTKFDAQVVMCYGIVRQFAHMAKLVLDKYGYDKINGAAFKDIAENHMAGYDYDGLGAPFAWSSTNHFGPHDVTIIKTKPHEGFEVLAKWYKMPPWPSQANDVSFWIQ